MYDARHVALAFCLDKTMQRKAPRPNPELEARILNEKREANNYAAGTMKHPIPYPNIKWENPYKERRYAPDEDYADYDPDFPFK